MFLHCAQSRMTVVLSYLFDTSLTWFGMISCGVQEKEVVSWWVISVLILFISDASNAVMLLSTCCFFQAMLLNLSMLFDDLIISLVAFLLLCFSLSRIAVCFFYKNGVLWGWRGWSSGVLCCSFTPFLFDVFCIPSGLFTDSANSEIAGAAAALS